MIERTWAATLVLVGLVATQSTAPAQTVSELLQKGIYTQETLGDLDGAIRIYRQLLAAAKQARPVAAQAQYRLALCLERKGAAEEAKKAFQKVIEDYPEQKELVARAREHMPGYMKLQPAPWTDGEVHELRFKTPSGSSVGADISQVKLAAVRPDTWVIERRQYVMGRATFVSRVEVDRETMRPIASDYRIFMFGQFHLEYQPRQVVIQTKDKEGSKKFDLDAPVYDNDEATFLLRRMPLAVGMKTPLKIVSVMGTGFVEVTAHVVALEDVEVPAGKFPCFKVELSLMKQTLWISNDSQRHLVKMEIGPVTGELIAVHKTEMTPVTLKDEKGRFSMILPPGWLTLPREATEPAPEDMIYLLDPEATAECLFWVGQYKTQRGFDIEMREEAEKVTKRREGELRNFKVRPESRRALQVGGRPAFTFVADYTDETNQAMIEYATWVRSDSLHTMFRARVRADELETFRRRFEPVIESLQLR